MNIRSIAIIGPGRMGGALALALNATSFTVRKLVARSREGVAPFVGTMSPRPELLGPDEFEKITEDVVIISTQDTEIESTSRNLAEHLAHRPCVLHTSGALSSSVLHELSAIGCETGSMHPLISISDPIKGSVHFAGAYFCLEGSLGALDRGKEIVGLLGGNSFSIDAGLKSLYHASAVVSSGHFVALISVAIEMLSACGLNERDAQRVLMPLIKSTVENLGSQTPAEALTGTFARGDAETLASHLAAIANSCPPSTMEIYKNLGRRSVELALKKGLDPGLADMMNALLKE